MEKRDGGIIPTANHNPKQWNALKLLNHKGEFLNAKDGEEILQLSENTEIEYAVVDDLGKIEKKTDYIQKHIDEILKLKWVDVEKIKSAGFKVVVDGVNSTGGIAIPQLLKQLGVEVVELHCEPNGHFPHDPEPLEKNLTALFDKVLETKSDLGIVV